MNRKNFLGHLALALTLILLAAVAGQIRRWRNEVRNLQTTRGVLTTQNFEFNSQQNATPDNAEDDVAFSSSGKAEIFVRFRSGTALSTIKDIALRRHDRVEDEIEAVDGLTLIEDEDGLNVDTVISEYNSLPDVEYVEPVFKVQADHDAPGWGKHKHANDEMFTRQWSLKNIGQDGGLPDADIKVMNAWVKTTGSSKVVVAVLDSGVDYTHPDLINNIWMRPEGMAPYVDDELGEFNDLHGFNAVNRWDDPMDDNGHGTHCAGIIGAEGDNNIGIAGINWNVKIMPLKFLSSTGSGSTKDAIEAINYVIDRKRRASTCASSARAGVRRRIRARFVM